VATLLELDPPADAESERFATDGFSAAAADFGPEENQRLNWEYEGLCESALMAYLREHPEERENYAEFLDERLGVLKWENRAHAPQLCVEVGINILGIAASVLEPIAELFPDAKVILSPNDPLLNAIADFAQPTQIAPRTPQPARRNVARKKVGRRTKSRRARAPAAGGDDRPPLDPRDCARNGCTTEFVPVRQDQPCCSKRCAAAHRKARSRAARATVPEYEKVVLAECVAGRLDFLAAIDWMTDPVGAAEAYRTVAA